MINNDNITFTASGFLRDPQYTFSLLGTLRNYNNSFGNAESLTMKLEEEIPGRPTDFTQNNLNITDDGLRIEITFRRGGHINPRGQITYPSGDVISREIHNVLINASFKYNLRFPQNL